MSVPKTTLVVFCKRPKLGQGKQRLAETIGADAAFELAALLVPQTATLIKEWRGRVIIALTDGADKEWSHDNLGPYKTIIQPTGGLGERISGIDSELRSSGHSRIIYIGTDSPILTSKQLVQAAKKLNHSDTVYIPTIDGGVSLMGARVPWPVLTDIRWSTTEMYHDIISLSDTMGISHTSLAHCYDVDHIEDLFRLHNDPTTRTRFPDFLWWMRTQHDTVKAELIDLSIIIPTYNDNSSLGTLLTQVNQLTPQPKEIIVVDGAENSDCQTLVSAAGATYITSPKGRGTQLNYGAQKATGAILWFVHADSSLPNNSIAHIQNAIAHGSESGCFSFRLAGPQSTLRKVFNWATNLRVRFSIPYGDQGIFMRSDLFHFLGGFESIPLFEEVSLMKRAKKQFNYAMLKISIGVSPRKYEHEGWIKTALLNRLYSIAFSLGYPADKLAYAYTHRFKQNNEADNA
ncbi:MAG: TIGR04283 family arsenosugar biosynthesis glycosyltransferase [Fibrobacterales bacterium]